MSKERSSVRVLFFNTSRNRMNIIKDEKIYNRSIIVFFLGFKKKKKPPFVSLSLENAARLRAH